MKIISAVICLLGINLFAGPFELDDHTLLLSHFDNADPYQVDGFANGLERFGGMGAKSIKEGRYGRAVDLRGILFEKDFVQNGVSNNARFDGFYLPKYDNINVYQGTFECWIRIPDRKKFTEHPIYRWNLLHPVFSYQAAKPKDKRSNSLNLSVSQNYIVFLFPFLSGDYVRGTIRFKRKDDFSGKFAIDSWHHLAICWSKGELVGYLDGRPFVTVDMTSQKGFVLWSRAQNGLNLGGVVLDELRISDNVRYHKAFEPDWPDGKRPVDAFPGVPNLPRYDAKEEIPYSPCRIKAPANPKIKEYTFGTLKFYLDTETGCLVKLGCDKQVSAASGNGLVINEGLEKKMLAQEKAGQWRFGKSKTGNYMLGFEQKFAGGVSAKHELTEDKNAVCWKIILKNDGDKEKWLEPQLSLPLPFGQIREFFDGSIVKTDFRKNLRGESYFYTMPLSIAFDGNKSLAMGIDPNQIHNDMVNELIVPQDSSRNGIMRQGIKVALSPGESYPLTFYIFTENKNNFGAIDALAAYQDRFPELYKQRPDVPIYAYMNTAMDYAVLQLPDIWRQCYVGMLYGGGPVHSKTDQSGIPKYWKNPRFNKHNSYKYARSSQKKWKTLENLHEAIPLMYRHAYDNYYPIRGSATSAGWSEFFIIKDVSPKYQLSRDPMTVFQAEYIINKKDSRFINECGPTGDFIRQDLKKFYQLMQPWNQTIINTKSIYVSSRFADYYTRRTPGRSFSYDRGTFYRGDVSRMKRYKEHNQQVNNGHRASMWSTDGGFISHAYCTQSAATGSNGVGDAFVAAMSCQGADLEVSRHLQGEKPFVFTHGFSWDYTPWMFQGMKWTAAGFRDYLRYRNAHFLLQMLKIGAHTDPIYYMGNLEAIERYPIVAESLISGRQPHAGGKVNKPLWMIRGGKGLKSFLAIGNQTAKQHKTDVQIFDVYFGGTPLFGNFLGGKTTLALTPGQVTIPEVEVAPRDMTGLRCLGIMNGPSKGKVDVDFQGDGINLYVNYQISINEKASLQLNSFAPLYKITSCKIDGKVVQPSRAGVIELKPGSRRVAVTLHNRVFDFTDREFAALDLYKDNKVNACMVTDKGYTYKNKFSGTRYELGFAAGTAWMFRDFWEQYDEENGIYGDIQLPEFVDKKPAGYTGWTLLFKVDPKYQEGKVDINPGSREIVFSGGSPGQIRQAMTVFLRQLDRKYPHVGRQIWLHFARGKKVKDIWKTVRLAAWRRKEFMQALGDVNFLSKPVLRKEHEKLYDNDNRDFEGKYTMKFSPYIYEPTFTDSYVYGYKGPEKPSGHEFKFASPQPKR